MNQSTKQTFDPQAVSIAVPVGKVYHSFSFGDKKFATAQDLANHLGMPVRFGAATYYPKPT